MRRRSVLKTAGGIGAGTLVTGMGLGAFSGSAAAKGQRAATANVNKFEPEETVTTDDGTVESLSVSGEMNVKYKGLDNGTNRIVMAVGVGNPDYPEEFDYSQLSGNENFEVDGPSGELSWDFGPYDVLENSKWEAADFVDTSKGEGAETTPVTFYCLVVIRSAGISVQTTKTIPVRV